MIYFKNMLTKCILFLFILVSTTADSYTSSCTKLRLEHGRARPRGRLIKFTCNSRYTLIGNRYATCRNGHWDVPTPICIRSGCPEIPHIKNGLQISSNDDAWIIFFCLPGFKIKGSPTIYCDGRNWNATAPICTNSTATPPLSCNFEDPDLCGWTNSDIHDFDWERLNKKTPSSFLNTGPSFDHTYGKGGSGYFMYIETTSRYENDTARLLSPVYDRKLLKDGCFSFFYHMYGNATGGLRVYLKPDFIDLQQITRQTEENQKYILFEKWGNQGDYWYSSVSWLTDVGDNFQIVIEGIRGNSFTSDIAIDDVAILEGNNCTAAQLAATTPTNRQTFSCKNRCFENETAGSDCKCSIGCFDAENCCHDYFDFCIFLPDFTIPDDELEPAPQTQKLIASTTESTSESITTTTRPTTTTSTTMKPTTVTKTSTTTTTTAKPTTAKPTTAKTTTTKKTTTSTTTKKPTTTKTIKTTKPVVTTRKVTIPTTPTTKVTPKSTTSLPFGISRTIENHNDYHSIIDKARKEKEVETRRIIHMQFEEPKSSGSIGWRIVLIIIGVVGLIGALSWLVLIARSSGGRETIARLRGHINDDPEVRFLSTDVDED